MLEKEGHTNALMATEKGVKPIEEEEEADRPDTFEEFSSNTTLHGVRFIGDHTFFLPRRLIWLCIVLLSASIFTYQVIDRVEYYLSSPITVNFKVNYNQSLKFPAITICNQNVFRVSEVFKNNLDYTIENMYGDPDYRANPPNNSELPLDELYALLTHLKEDLIITCRFGAYECSPDNFTTTLTSHGICYTFNKVDSYDDVINVYNSGVEHGLKLVLNTEKYEKFDGPHHTDGIKLIATDQSEIPSVEEIGTAISAGAHAYVGLNVLSLNNLEPPYGQCGSVDLLTTTRYTKDSCMLECKTAIITEICGCRDFYMPDMFDGIGICTISKWFTCLQRELELFNEHKDVLCNCPTACVYNIYDTSVSYARKTDWATFFNRGQFLYQRQHQIIQSFRAAQEVNTNMNINEMQELKFDFYDVVEAITWLAELLEYHGLSAEYDIKNIQEAFDESTMIAADQRDSLYDFQIFIIEKNFIRGRDSMEEKSFGVLCQSYREFLNDYIYRINYLLNSDEEIERKITHMMLEGAISNKLRVASDARDSYIKLINAYENGEPLLNNTFRMFDSMAHTEAVPRYLLNQCLNSNDILAGSTLSLDDIDRVTMILNSLKNINSEIFYNKTLDQAVLMSLGYELSDACENFLDRKSLLYSEVIEKPVKLLKQRQNKLAILKENYKSAYENVIGHINGIRSSIANAPSAFSKVNETVSNGLSYFSRELDDNVTKLDIALQLSSEEMSLNLQNLDSLLADIKGRAIGINESLPIYANRLYEIWARLLEFYNDNDRYDVYMNDTRFFLYDYSTLIVDYIDPIKDGFNDMAMKFERTHHPTMQRIKDIIHSMQKYFDSTRFNDAFFKENFMEVDIYFKELRSEQIDQQKAYDQFALLCDIGGSMGLFIGGSAITFFEIVDFLVLCFVHKAVLRRSPP